MTQATPHNPDGSIRYEVYPPGMVLPPGSSGMVDVDPWRASQRVLHILQGWRSRFVGGMVPEWPVSGQYSLKQHGGTVSLESNAANEVRAEHPDADHKVIYTFLHEPERSQLDVAGLPETTVPMVVAGLYGRLARILFDCDRAEMDR